tara:strand:+ start:800 stop:1021 length:222 start_codon:yes stop_codon:yes gene_type:complete
MPDKKRRLSLEDKYGIELPKKRNVPRWNFPIMDFGDDEDEDSIQESQDFQGSGICPEACGKASRRDARKNVHD